MYIINKELNQIHTCFNIGPNGNLEFFKERQVQCNEINDINLQVFYCPSMNNYYKFNRLNLDKNFLQMFSDIDKKLFEVDLNDFQYSFVDTMYRSKNNNSSFKIIIENEIINDFIECSI